MAWLAGESPAGGTRPVATVVLSGGGAGDQSVESPAVKPRWLGESLVSSEAHDYAQLGVTEIARTICELLGWKRPSGRLKHHECRQLLERLQAEGVLMLPALRPLGGKGPQCVDISEQLLEPEPVECASRECEPLELPLVEGETESKLWREHVERYHYLGCRVPFGANLRLLGAESRSGTCLPVVDVARLENAGARRLDRVER